MLAKFTSARVGAELDFAAALVALDDPDPALRRAAALVLRGGPEAATPLLDRLARETSEEVRSAILTSLIGLRSAEVAHALAEALGADDVALRNAVVEALAAMPDEALAALRARIVSDRPLLRLFVVQTLCRIEHKEARRLLGWVLADEPDVNICLAAFDGLADEPDAEFFAAELAARFPDVAQVRSLVRFFSTGSGARQPGGRA